MIRLMMVLFAAVSLPVIAQDANPDMDFLSQVIGLVRDFGGLPWMAKIAGVCLLIIASMKVSFLKPIWDRLGSAKVFAAPVLGLIAGVLSMGSGISWASVLAYAGAGAGAIILHELLDAVKAIPGLGSVYVSIIDIVSGLLKAPKA